jgi:hypothetical protein
MKSRRIFEDICCDSTPNIALPRVDARSWWCPQGYLPPLSFTVERELFKVLAQNQVERGEILPFAASVVQCPEQYHESLSGHLQSHKDQ